MSRSGERRWDRFAQVVFETARWRARDRQNRGLNPAFRSASARRAAKPLCFSDYVLTGVSQELVPKTPTGMRIYFTDYTLTGQPSAFPLHESESGLRLGGRVGLLVQPSFARRLPTFLHRLHFDWTTGRFLLREVGLRMQAGCPVGEAFARR